MALVILLLLLSELIFAFVLLLGVAAVDDNRPLLVDVRVEVEVAFLAAGAGLIIELAVGVVLALLLNVCSSPEGGDPGGDRRSGTFPKSSGIRSLEPFSSQFSQ